MTVFYRAFAPIPLGSNSSSHMLGIRYLHQRLDLLEKYIAQASTLPAWFNDAIQALQAENIDG